jgi:hypothetical protein
VTTEEKKGPVSERRRMTLSGRIVIGLTAGISCGLFFGEICGRSSCHSGTSLRGLSGTRPYRAIPSSSAFWTSGSDSSETRDSSRACATIGFSAGPQYRKARGGR